MTMKKLSHILIVGLLLITSANILGVCPECFKNVKPMPGSGAASDGSGRREITVRFGGTFNTQSGTDPRIWNAFAGCNGCPQGANSQWNDMTDTGQPGGNKTGYHLAVNQTAQDPDVIVELVPNGTFGLGPDSPAASGQRKDSTGRPIPGKRVIYVTPSILDWAAQDLAAVMAHEVGHLLGLADKYGSTGCQTIVNQGGASNGGRPLTKTVQPGDIQMVNVQFNDGTRNTCTRTRTTTVTFTSDPTPTPTPEPTPDPMESGSSDCNDWVDNDGDGLTDCEDPGCNHSCPGGCNQAMFDICSALGAPYCVGGQCYTPILVDVLGDGLKLTNAHNGILFNVLPGKLLRIAWTEPNSDDAWLILDRNGNGAVDSGEEMFGNAAPQPPPPAGIGKNGFNALAVYDQPGNGGNDDGIIDKQDSAFSALRLWQDRNHNGISEPAELSTLTDLGLNSIGLDYKESRKTDSYGNRWMYRAKVKDKNDAQLGRWAWDVFLVSGY